MGQEWIWCSENRLLPVQQLRLRIQFAIEILTDFGRQFLVLYGSLEHTVDIVVYKQKVQQHAHFHLP